jgi:hypothetical protein
VLGVRGVERAEELDAVERLGHAHGDVVVDVEALRTNMSWMVRTTRVWEEERTDGSVADCLGPAHATLKCEYSRTEGVRLRIGAVHRDVVRRQPFLKLAEQPVVRCETAYEPHRLRVLSISALVFLNWGVDVCTLMTPADASICAFIARKAAERK